MRRATLTSNSLPSIRERQSLGFSVSEFELSMAERFGEEVARRFIEHFGGLDIYIPLAPNADHQIAMAAGMDVLAWLIDVYGSGELHFPLGAKSPWSLASFRLCQLIAEGNRTDREIARAARCDTRTVRNVRRNMRAKGIVVPPPRHQARNSNEETP